MRQLMGVQTFYFLFLENIKNNMMFIEKPILELCKHINMSV